MELINITPPPAKPISQELAEGLLDSLNVELFHRIEFHKIHYTKFWDHPDVLPDEILASMGNNAALFLSAASENLRSIATLAGMVGKTLDDAIPPEFYRPRRDFIPGENGSFTLAPPAEGYDMRGNLINA